MGFNEDDHRRGYGGKFVTKERSAVDDAALDELGEGPEGVPALAGGPTLLPYDETHPNAVAIRGQDTLLDLQRVCDAFDVAEECGYNHAETQNLVWVSMNPAQRALCSKIEERAAELHREGPSDRDETVGESIVAIGTDIAGILATVRVDNVKFSSDPVLDEGVYYVDKKDPQVPPWMSEGGTSQVVLIDPRKDPEAIERAVEFRNWAVV